MRLLLTESKREMAELNRRSREVLEGNKRLWEENLALMQKMNFPTVPSPVNSSAIHSSLCLMILKWVAQSSLLMFRSAPLLTLLKESTITSFVLIRFFLNVECTPTAVYRMRRVQPQKNRLIKVILPPSRFQQDVVSRAPRLLFYSHKGVYLPPPLTH